MEGAKNCPLHLSAAFSTTYHQLALTGYRNMRAFRRHHGEEEGRHRRRGIRLQQRHPHLRRERERRRQTVEAGEGGRADGGRDASRGGVAARPGAAARPLVVGPLLASITGGGAGGR